jgi:hypothetical protein
LPSCETGVFDAAPHHSFTATFSVRARHTSAGNTSAGHFAMWSGLTYKHAGVTMEPKWPASVVVSEMSSEQKLTERSGIGDNAMAGAVEAAGVGCAMD